MLCVRAHDCDPGRVSDGSRLALTKLSLSSDLLYFSGSMCFVWLFLYFCRFGFVFSFSFSSSSLVGALKMFSWYFPVQLTTWYRIGNRPRILLSMWITPWRQQWLFTAVGNYSYASANLSPPGVWFADIMTSFSGFTFVLFCFVFVFKISLKPRPLVRFASDPIW